MKTISVVTPCFNEEGNVREVYERVRNLMLSLGKYRYEHIFIDNASRDTTFTVQGQVMYGHYDMVAPSQSVSLNGSTVNGYVFSYAINASANQSMTVSLSAPSGSAYLDIFGLGSGTILGSSAKATSWTGTLPETQDYVIEVIPSNGQVVDYGVTVTVK